MLPPGTMQRSRPRNSMVLNGALAVLCAVAAGAASATESGSASPIAAQAAGDAGEQLRAAASRGEVETLRALLDGGSVDVDAANEYGATALILACNRGHTEAAQALLEADADPDRPDTFYEWVPLQWAALASSEEIVSLLFQNGAEGFDALFANAVAAGDLERVAYLATLNTPSEELLSAALVAATEARNSDMVGLLDRMGAMPPPPEVFDIDAETLRRYEGLYVDEVGYQLEVRADLDDKVLLVKPLGLRNALRFFAASESIFVSEQAANVYAEFVVREGRVLSMTFSQAGSNRRLTKQ